MTSVHNTRQNSSDNLQSNSEDDKQEEYSHY